MCVKEEALLQGIVRSGSSRVGSVERISLAGETLSPKRSQDISSPTNPTVAVWSPHTGIPPLAGPSSPPNTSLLANEHYESELEGRVMRLNLHKKRENCTCCIPRLFSARVSASIRLDFRCQCRWGTLRE